MAYEPVPDALRSALAKLANGELYALCIAHRSRQDHFCLRVTAHEKNGIVRYRRCKLSSEFALGTDVYVTNVYADSNEALTDLIDTLSLVDTSIYFEFD